MRYRLRRLVLGVPAFIEISKDEFEQLKRTQKNLLNVLNIEATFDLLLENYAEFERECLGLGLRLALFARHGEPLGAYREMNRRVVNLLSSARLYTEQVPKELDAIYGEGSKHAATFNHYGSQQKAFLAYRAMEALRNHAQHFGFLVYAATHSLTWENTNAEAGLRAGLKLFVNLQRLKDDRNLNKEDKKIVDELATKVDRYGNINLTPMVREYMEKLCEVHQSLRDLISADIAFWDQIIISAEDRARATFGEDLSGIGVTAEDKDDEGDYRSVDSESIDVRLIEWRKGLKAKNRDFGKLSALYVTGNAGHSAV